MLDLTPIQKKHLKALAHNLNAAVLLGKSGLTDSLIAEIDRSLAIHELIKVKFNKSKEEKTELGEQLAEKSNSTFVSFVGNNLIIYNEAELEEDRKIKLP